MAKLTKMFSDLLKKVNKKSKTNTERLMLNKEEMHEELCVSVMPNGYSDIRNFPYAIISKG